MDLSDSKLEDVFKQEKLDFVIHLAAQASVTVSMIDPYLDFNTNTVGTVKTLLLSKKHNVRKFIFASTAAVYGDPSYLPIDEKHLLNPLSFYSLSKYSAENYIKLNGTFNGLDHCILRFSNVYGPRQKPVHKPLRLGEIKKSILDNGRARNELNWHLQHSPLEGLKETVQYYSEVGN